MKRYALLFILMSFVLGAKANHWTPNSAPYANTASMIGIIQINGVEQSVTSLEIGAFCGDECRASGMPMYVTQLDHYILFMSIYGNDGDELGFRVYDHNLNQELDLTCASTVTFTANTTFGSPASPFVLNFEDNPVTYTITASANPAEGGTVTGSGTYEEGTTATLEASANVGYTFENWTKDGVLVSTNTTFSFVVMESGNYVANFYEISSHLHWAPNDAPYANTASMIGLIQINGVEQNTTNLEVGAFCGDECRASGVPMYIAQLNRYILFMSIYGNDDDVLNFRIYDHNLNQELDLNCASTVTFTANMTFGSPASPFVLNFEDIIVTYTITATANPAEGGIVTGAGTYNQDTTATLTASANTGYTFVNWTENGSEVSTSATYNFTVTGERTLVANFSLNSYDITVTADPAEGGMATGDGTYSHGATATLTATANEGYTFVNWTENDMEVSTATTYSFTVTADRTLVANFANNVTYHWIVDPSLYADNMSVVGIVQIDGVEQFSDALEIGAFCGDECRGRERTAYSSLVERYLVFLTVYGETGDVITFRLFDHQTDQESNLECATTLTFTINDMIGTALDPYMFNFTDPTMEQVTNLTANWNWYSTYIELEGVDGLTMLEEALGANAESINSQTAFTRYYGEYGWYGSLTGINNESMYRLKMTNAATITMTGVKADPSAHPITVTKGWCHIAFLSSEPMTVAAALAGLASSPGDMVKSQTRFANYYEGYGWYGSLSNAGVYVNPGEGLMYKSVADEAKTFTYPATNRDIVADVTAENNHWANDAHTYPDNMTVLAVVELDGVELGSEDYELAAFADDGCRGSIRLAYIEPLHRHAAFLTVAGDEPQELRFALYNAMTGEAVLDADERVVFTADGTVGEFDAPFVLHFRQTTGVGETAVNALVYPNPTDGDVMIEAPAMTHVTVTNTLGQVLYDTDANGDRLRLDFGQYQAGLYLIRVVTENGTAIKKVTKD